MSTKNSKGVGYGVRERFPPLSLSLVSFLLENVRFRDEDDSIPNSALARTNVILAGKRGSRRHSTTSCSTNIVVAETSYQILEV